MGDTEVHECHRHVLNPERRAAFRMADHDWNQ